MRLRIVQGSLRSRIRNFSKEKKCSNVLTIFPITLGVCVAVGLGQFVKGSPSLVAGAMVAFFPIIFVKCSEKNRQMQTSLEGDILVSELLSNYKMNYCNILEAINKTVYSIEDAPNSKIILLELAKALNENHTQDKVYEALENFQKSIGTSWGRLLSNSIFMGHTMGINITRSLEDLLNNIRSSKKAVEYRKRTNNEARLMLKWLAPICYLLTVVGACKYFGFTLKKYLEYQFTTALGVTWFLIVLGAYLLGIVVNQWLTKTKLDL